MTLRNIGGKMSRRMFLASSVPATAALYSLLQEPFRLADQEKPEPEVRRAVPVRAERIIFIFMSGGPSQVDLFDPKPKLQEMHGTVIPPSVLRGESPPAIGNKVPLPLVGTTARFKQYGNCGMEMSSLLPHIGSLADEITLIRSVHTDQVNHEPATTFMLTGSQLAGRPSTGSWVSYGLGSMNQNLPSFVALMSGEGGEPITSRYWHNGFLPGKHQGVPFRNHGDAVLYLTDPEGIDGSQRQGEISAVNQLNQMRYEVSHDPEIEARIRAYELAYRMQSTLPDLINLSTEPAEALRSYGVTPGQGSFAANCLLARRLVEQGVRFVQLIHRGWDNHENLPVELRKQCYLTDRPVAALIKDLKRKGLLDSTLIVWAGEFGRTPYAQALQPDGNFGRDHHRCCFSAWMAGGPVKQGFTYGATDDFGHNIVENPIHIHDLNATILHCLGIDHEKLVYRHQGRDFRLTDTSGRVVHDLLV